jgi:hypothetical protein
VERAKGDLGIKPAKSGMAGGWSWSLPKNAKMAEECQPQNVAVFEKLGGLRESEEVAEVGQRSGNPEAARREVWLDWCEWKAVALNRLFLEQGAIGQPGRITAETVRHGECNRHEDSGPMKGEDP